MNRLAKRTLLASLFVAVPLGLAACGDDTAGTGGTGTPDSAAPDGASSGTQDGSADAAAADATLGDAASGDAAASDATAFDATIADGATVDAADAAAQDAGLDAHAQDAGDAQTSDAGDGGTDGAVFASSQIKHVFVIVLENKNYADTFGTSTQDPYLTGTLAPAGALLTQYYGTGHVSLDNYISMISGQSSTLETEADCQNFDNFNLTGIDDAGQAIGTGCVYPTSVKSLPDQLKAAGYTWRGYMEDMGNDPARESATCGHVALDAGDVTQQPEAPSVAVDAGDQYAGRHNPFIYFHSIIDSADCATNVVNLTTLPDDLASEGTTPNFVFITPNLCHDGHDGDGTGNAGKGCVNGEPGGLKSSDLFLQAWVPQILASPAYQKDGMLLITFDESSTASTSVATNDAGVTTITATFTGASCCGQQIGPNVIRPSTQQFVVSSAETYDLVTTGVGGDRIGAVLLSKFISPGTVSNTPYNHYSMLRSVEDIFGLGYLGYAGQSGLVGFGSDIYTRPNP